jgi:hypothetical protein
MALDFSRRATGGGARMGLEDPSQSAAASAARARATVMGVPIGSVSVPSDAASREVAMLKSHSNTMLDARSIASTKQTLLLAVRPPGSGARDNEDSSDESEAYDSSSGSAEEQTEDDEEQQTLSASDDDQSDSGEEHDSDGDTSSAPLFPSYQSVLVRVAQTVDSGTRRAINRKMVIFSSNLRHVPEFSQRERLVRHHLQELSRYVGVDNIERFCIYPTSDVQFDEQSRPQPTGITMIVRGSTPVAPLMGIKWGRHRAALKTSAISAPENAASLLKAMVESGDVLDESLMDAAELTTASRAHTPVLASDGSVAFCSGFQRSGASNSMYGSVVVTNHSARALATVRELVQHHPAMTVAEFFHHRCYAALMSFGQLETLGVMTAAATRVHRAAGSGTAGGGIAVQEHSIGYDALGKEVKMRITTPWKVAPLCYIRAVERPPAGDGEDDVEHANRHELYEIHIDTFGETEGIVDAETARRLHGTTDSTQSFGYVFNDGPQIGFTVMSPLKHDPSGAWRMWRLAQLSDLVACSTRQEVPERSHVSSDSVSAVTTTRPMWHSGYPSSGFYLDISDDLNDKKKPVITSGLVRPYHNSAAFFTAADTEHVARLAPLRTDIEVMLHHLFPVSHFTQRQEIETNSTYVAGFGSRVCDFPTLLEARSTTGDVHVYINNWRVMLQAQYLLMRVAAEERPAHRGDSKRRAFEWPTPQHGRLQLPQKKLRDWYAKYGDYHDAPHTGYRYPQYYDRATRTAGAFLKSHDQVCELAQLMSLQHHSHLAASAYAAGDDQ